MLTLLCARLPCRRSDTRASNESLIDALRWINSEESPPVDVVSLSLGSLPEIAQAVTKLENGCNT